MEFNQYYNQFKQDSVYSEFLSDNFNVQNAMITISGLPFAEQIAKISSGIDHIKSSINQLIAQNCETFFKRATKLDELYEELRFIRIKSKNLSKTIESMKTKFQTTHQQLSREIILLARLQKTCDLLRKMLRIMHLIERIDESNCSLSKNEQSIRLKEMIKLSQYVNEIDGILQSDPDGLLFKLNPIKKDLVKFQVTRDRLNSDVALLLKTALDTMDINSIGAALQIYHNLKTLDQVVDDLIETKCQFIRQSSLKLFDDIIIKDSKLTQQSSRQNNLVKTSIRTCCKSTLENVCIHFGQISLVVKLLKKRRDNQTQTLLIEFLRDKQNLLIGFWEQIIEILTETFEKLFRCSSPIKKIIENDYPKILAIFLEYWKRLCHDEPELEQEKPLRSVIVQFENAYLSNSISLLFESVNRIFPNVESAKNSTKIESVPSERDVDLVLKDITNEIMAVNFDRSLSESVCKNIIKTINLFLIKCERIISNDGDATQVISKFTVNQRHNSLIVYILNYFGGQLKNLMTGNNNNGVPDSIKDSLDSSLKSIDTLIENIIEPFIFSIQDAIEDIILTIHNEKYDLEGNGSAKNESPQCSLYMKELQRFILRVSQDYFQQYPDAAIIQKRIHQMAAFVIDFFLLQNCLIRPVSSWGRNKIATDFAQLESAILPICQRLGDLGRSFQILKAFKTLLPLQPEQISGSTLVGDPVPLHLIVHFLIANYATNELKSPHQFKEWSISRYSKWFFEQTNDSDKLLIVRMSLNAYVADVKKSQKKTFISIYPILMDLMRKADETNQ